MAFNQGCKGLVPNDLVEGRFLVSALIHLRPAMAAAGTGTTFQELSSGALAELPLPCPSRDEQRAISDFLDRETAQIDAMVEALERLVALLEERRTSLLDHLIRQLTERHGVARLKSLATVTVGIVVTPSKWYVDVGVPALRGVNVRAEALDLSELVYLTAEGDQSHVKSRLTAGDVVVVRTGRAGTAAVVPASLEGANAIDLLIVRPDVGLSGDFLAAVINSHFVSGQIEALSVGAIQSHFNVAALREVEIPNAPDDDQEMLVARWHAARDRVDAMIAKAQESVALMKERRGALIDAAVTGRMDIHTGIEQVELDLEEALA